MRRFTALALIGAVAMAAAASPSAAQSTVPAAPTTAAQPVPAVQGVPVDASFVIGTDDLLAIVFWELPNHSAEVAVRPDGKITLPLLNEVQASGLTPDQLRTQITTAAAKYIRDPQVSVIVKQINSRKVFVTGKVLRPGSYPITQPTTVLQMLAIAGGTSDFAKTKKIAIMRTEHGQTQSFKFNYGEVLQGKKLDQNIVLMPGDTIVVP
jgi:polysaccharide export outer membrane protein